MTALDDLKLKFFKWYDAHISAGWYRAWSLYVGMVAALFPYLLGILDAALAQWPDVAGALKLSPVNTMLVQIFLATVVLPAARAWQQKTVREANLVQAIKTGQVSSEPGSEQVDVNVKP